MRTTINSDIDVDYLKDSTRHANQATAQDIINRIPELTRAAAEKAEPWTVVMTFFGQSGLGRLAFDGQLEHLTGAPKLVYDHLVEMGLNPSLFWTSGEGNLPGKLHTKGNWYHLVACWDTASEHNELRKLYEDACQAKAKAITDKIPELVAEAASEGHSWVSVMSFFAVLSLSRTGLQFDGETKNLAGVPRLVYEYLTDQGLKPRLLHMDGDGILAGVPSKGTWYHLIAQWHETAGGGSNQ